MGKGRHHTPPLSVDTRRKIFKKMIIEEIRIIAMNSVVLLLNTLIRDLLRQRISRGIKVKGSWILRTTWLRIRIL